MRPSCSTASNAATRPLMVADPMFRAGRPDTVAASNLYPLWARARVEQPTRIIPNDKLNFVVKLRSAARAFIEKSSFNQVRTYCGVRKSTFFRAVKLQAYF